MTLPTGCEGFSSSELLRRAQVFRDHADMTKDRADREFSNRIASEYEEAARYVRANHGN
jgi:hypothetical protein